LVATLRLRAVLVPSSLPNLARLDLVFGIGISLLVSLSLAWVTFWSQRVPPQAPKRMTMTMAVTRRPPEVGSA
jgi:hypothetical protein